MIVDSFASANEFADHWISEASPERALDHLLDLAGNMEWSRLNAEAYGRYLEAAQHGIVVGTLITRAQLHANEHGLRDPVLSARPAPY
jgi:hypothetical protein